MYFCAFDQRVHTFAVSLQGAKGIAVPKMLTFCQHAKHKKVSPFCPSNTLNIKVLSTRKAQNKCQHEIHTQTKFRSCLPTYKRQQNLSTRYPPNKSAGNSAHLGIHQSHIYEIFCQDIGLCSSVSRCLSLKISNREKCAIPLKCKLCHLWQP